MTIYSSNIKKVHDNAKKKVLVAFHTLRTNYDTQRRQIVTVYEGKEDSMYYDSVIVNILKDDWEIIKITAGSRNSVIELYEKVDWNVYNKNGVLFFLDRDLSPFTGERTPNDENIYVTSKYSIENQIVDFFTFEKVLTEVLNVEIKSKRDRERIRRIFLTQFKRFKKELIEIMCWIILWKLDGEKACLDDIRMKDLFEFCEFKLETKFVHSSLIEYLHRSCKIQYSKQRQTKISKIKRDFQKLRGEESFIRGKYVLWFYVNMALHLSANIEKLTKGRSKKQKQHINFGEKNAMILIASRAKTPKELIKFVSDNYSKYLHFIRGKYGVA